MIITIIMLNGNDIDYNNNDVISAVIEKNITSNNQLIN